MDKVSGRRGFGAVVGPVCPAPAAVFSGLARVAWVMGGFFIPIPGLFVVSSFVRCLGLGREKRA